MFRFRNLLNIETGQTMVFAAILLVALLGFGAYGVDLGYMTVQKSNLQKAADAGALAGASLLSSKSDSEVQANAESLAEVNLKETAQIPTPVVNRTDETVTVTITQAAPKLLAGVLTSSTHNIAVSSTAKNNNWAGDVLPLVNHDEKYIIGEDLVAWEKIGFGNFESVVDDEYEVQYDSDGNVQGFLFTDYSNGIDNKHGVVAKIKDECDEIAQSSKYAYLWSLSEEAIEAGTYTKIKNGKTIPLSDLVILKVQINGFDIKTKSFDLTVMDVFTLDGVDDYPVFANPNHETRSFLID